MHVHVLKLKFYCSIHYSEQNINVPFSQIGEKCEQHREDKGHYQQEIQGFSDPMGMDVRHRADRTGRSKVLICN